MAERARCGATRDIPDGLRQFFKDTAAATAVEFALVLFPFLGLLGATIDAALLHFRASQLQITAEYAARDILVSKIERDDKGWSLMTNKAFREQYVCTWQKTGVVAPGTLGRMFDCSKVIVRIDNIINWSSSSLDLDDDFTKLFDTNRFRVPDPGRIAVLRIVYPVNTFFNFLGRSASSLAQISPDARMSNVVMGVTAFRVEPGTAP